MNGIIFLDPVARVILPVTVHLTRWSHTLFESQSSLPLEKYFKTRRLQILLTVHPLKRQLTLVLYERS